MKNFIVVSLFLLSGCESLKQQIKTSMISPIPISGNPTFYEQTYEGATIPEARAEVKTLLSQEPDEYTFTRDNPKTGTIEGYVDINESDGGSAEVQFFDTVKGRNDWEKVKRYVTKITFRFEKSGALTVRAETLTQRFRKDGILRESGPAHSTWYGYFFARLNKALRPS